VVQTFVLLEPHALTLIEGTRFKVLEGPTNLPPHFLLLDGFNEKFTTIPWPKIPWHEKKNFVRNKLLALNPIHTVFESQSQNSLAQGVSGALTQEKQSYEKLKAQDTLMGVGFFAYAIAHPFKEPTALIVEMPAGTTRLYYCHQGAPLFARTLPSCHDTRPEDINATLYHLERHFQTPKENINIIQWTTQDLINALKTYKPKSLAFAHPFKKECLRAKRLLFFKKSAPIVSVLLAVSISFQGYSLFENHLDKQGINEKIQQLTLQDNPQEKTSTFDPTFIKVVQSYERIKEAPCPLETLKTVSCLNTTKSRIHALTWKNESGVKPLLRLQVCARVPTKNHDFEKYVLETLSRTKEAPTFHLVNDESISLQDDVPTTSPCLFLETSKGEKRD